MTKSTLTTGTPKVRHASAPVAADRIGFGIGSCLAAVFLFSIVDATGKWLGQSYEPVQVVFLRHLFSLIPIAVFVWRSGGLAALKTQHPFAHVCRGGLMFAPMLLFFTALRGLPRGEGRRRGRDLLETHGLGHAIDRQIRQLSKGMAQTVQLLGTLVHRPKLEVLDEQGGD